MKHLRLLLTKQIRRLGYHPLHVILGVITVIVGVCLILDDHYFFWPPGFSYIFNSDFIGTTAVFTGAGIIYVAIQRFIPSQANTIWLLLECAFAGLMCGLEFSHGMVNHNEHMILFSVLWFGYLLFTLYVIRKNGLRDSKLAKRLEERDRKIKEGR